MLVCWCLCQENHSKYWSRPTATQPIVVRRSPEHAAQKTTCIFAGANAKKLTRSKQAKSICVKPCTRAYLHDVGGDAQERRQEGVNTHVSTKREGKHGADAHALTMGEGKQRA
eukprot:scaffold232400_cov18-Tisochrysis_lutea.AAC.1